MKSIHLRILSKMGLDQTENFLPKASDEKSRTQPESSKGKSYGLGLQIMQIKTQPKDIIFQTRVSTTRTKPQGNPRLPKIESKIDEEKRIVVLPVINKTPKPKPKKSRTLQDITPSAVLAKQVENQENQGESRTYWQLHTTPQGKSKDLLEKPSIPEEPEDNAEPPITIIQSRIRSNFDNSYNQSVPVKSFNELTLKGSLVSNQVLLDTPFTRKSLGSKSHREIIRLKAKSTTYGKDFRIGSLKSTEPLSRKQSNENLHQVKIDDKEDIEKYRFESSDEEKDGKDMSLEEYLINKKTENVENFEFDYTTFTKTMYKPNTNIKVLKLE